MAPANDLTPLVGVVVVTYNQQEFVALAVESVLAQTHERLECVVVDDGSGDATFERVETIARRDPRVKAFTKQNGGPGSARNYGAARVGPEAEFIAFLDGDDLYRPGYLEEAIRYMRAHPEAGVVIPSWDLIDGAGALLPHHRRGHRWVPSSLWLPRRLRSDEPATPFITFYCGNGAVSFWIGRQRDYRQTDGWDETLWQIEDVDMLCQLAFVTEVHRITNKLVAHRIHSRQASQLVADGTQASTSRPPEKRPPVGIRAVQEKWNRRHYSERAKDRILDIACIYYRQVHLPFRALWVARRAFLEFLQAPSRRSFAWFATLLGYFLRDFTYFKIFFWQSTRRYAATRFYETALPSNPLASHD